MLADVITAISLLKSIIQVYESMLDTYTCGKRLLERTLTFNEVVEKFKNDDKAANVKSHSIRQLVILLEEIRDFGQKYAGKKGTSFFNQTVSMLTKASFRNSQAEELASLNSRLNDLALDLCVASEIDYEAQRVQDLADAKAFFENSVNKVCAEMSKSGADSTAMMEDLKKDIADNKMVLNQIMVAMGHRKLNRADENELNEFNTKLVLTIEAKHKEVMDKLNSIHADVIDMKNDIIDLLQKIMGDGKASNLTNEEVGKRKGFLNDALLQPSQIEVDRSSKLGSGAFGSVYRGIFEGSIEIAVKTAMTIDESSLIALENEIILMRNLSHPRVLMCYGYRMEMREFLIALELAPCGSLQMILRDRTSFPVLPFPLSLQWLQDLCSAVAYLHRNRIKHRDIKAENLLVFHGLHLKICDFGLAKEHMSSAGLKSTIAGTTNFMAPEVKLGIGSVFASDVYSIAMTTLQILNRGPPSVYNAVAEQIEGACSNRSIVPEVCAESLKNLLLAAITYRQTPELKDLNKLRPTAQEFYDEVKRIESDFSLKPERQTVSNIETAAKTVFELASSLPSVPSAMTDMQSTSSKGPPQRRSSVDEDTAFVEELSDWLVSKAKLGRKFAKTYAASIYNESGIYTADRIAKKVSKDASWLKSVGVSADDSDEILDALRTAGLLQATTDSCVDVVSADDTACINELSSWLLTKASIVPKLAKTYATSIYNKSALFTPDRIAKKVSKNSRWLEEMGVSIDDGEEIVEALTNAGLLNSASVSTPTTTSARVTFAQPSEDSSKKPVPPIPAATVPPEKPKKQSTTATAVGDVEKKHNVTTVPFTAEESIRPAEDPRKLQASASPPTTTPSVKKEIVPAIQSPKHTIIPTVEIAARVHNYDNFETLRGHTKGIFGMIQLSDGRICSAGSDNDLRVWSRDMKSCEKVLTGHTNSVVALCEMNDGSLCSAGQDKTIRVWNIQSGANTKTLSGHTDSIFTVFALPDGRLVSGSADKTVRIWNLSTSQCDKVISGHTDSVQYAILLRDGTICTASWDKTLRIFNPTTGAMVRQFTGHTADVVHVTQLSDGRLCSCSLDATIRIWNSSSGACEKELRGHTINSRWTVQLSGGQLVSCSKDKTIRLWDLTSGQTVKTLTGHSDYIRCLLLLSDGRIVSGSDDCTMRVWGDSVGTGKLAASSTTPVKGPATAGIVATAPLQNYDNFNTLRGHTKGIWGIIQLSDGRICSAGSDNDLRVWSRDMATCEKVLTGHMNSVVALCEMQDGSLCSGGMDKTVRVWNIQSGANTKTLSGHTDSIFTVLALPDGRLVSGSSDNTLRIWNLSTSQCDKVISGHTDSVQYAILLRDGTICTASWDKTLRIFNPTTGATVRQFTGHADKVLHVTQLSDGRLCSCSLDATIRIWNSSSGACEKELRGHTINSRWTVQLSGGQLVSCSKDKTIRLWDLTSGQTVKTLTGHSDYIRCLLLLSDGRIVSGSDDCTMRVWGNDSVGIGKVAASSTTPVKGPATAGSARNYEQFVTLRGHTKGIWGMIQLSDGRICSAGSDNDLRVWSRDMATCEKVLKGHTGSVVALCEMKDGSLCSGGMDKTVRVWNIQSGANTKTLSGHTDTVLTVFALPDGRLVSGSADKTLRIWNLSTSQCDKVISGHTDAVQYAILLRDGTICTASWDKTLRIFNPTTGAMVRQFTGHTAEVVHVIQLSDGRLCSCSLDATIRIWNSSSGACEKELRGHTINSRWTVQLSGGQLVSCSKDKTIRLWDLTSGQTVKTLTGHIDYIRCLLLLSDGRIVSGSDDCTMRVWGDRPDLSWWESPVTRIW